MELTRALETGGGSVEDGGVAGSVGGDLAVVVKVYDAQIDVDQATVKLKL